MSLPDKSVIIIKDQKKEIQFLWEEFDGDDCFNKHQIIIFIEENREVFDFGPCVVWGLRKMTRFLENKSEQSTGSGFRNPGIMYYDLYRKGCEYRLVINIEDENKSYEYFPQNPIIMNDRIFISRYDGEEP